MKSLSIPNIVPTASLQIINESGEKPIWQTLERDILYTPAAINKALKKRGLDSAWIRFMGSRELWQQTDGNLAKRSVE